MMAIPTLLDKRLPVALAPHKLLLKILDAIHDFVQVISTVFVQDISTVEDGLLMTLAIPLASSQTVFEVYRANVILMPQNDSVYVLQWVIEGE